MSASREDEIRFERLFRDNYQRLYLYALDWVEDEEQAKDIVGTLMSDLWAKRDRWPTCMARCATGASAT